LPDGAAGVAPRKRTGRPPGFGKLRSEENAELICDWIVEGKTLREIAGALGCTAGAISKWADDDATFAQRYARAREMACQLLVDDLLALSDADCIGPDGLPDNALVQRARLMVDTRKWILSKVLPKRFGDRVTAEITGDPNAPLITRIELVAVPAVHRQLGPVIDAGCDDGSEPSTLPKPKETLEK
jgi:terminase small subunit-like protein